MFLLDFFGHWFDLPNIPTKAIQFVARDLGAPPSLGTADGAMSFARVVAGTRTGPPGVARNGPANGEAR